MAEFGVATGLIGIVSFGIQVAQGLLHYYGSWRDQDSDVVDMCASLNSLSTTLAVLAETFQRHDRPSMSIEKRVVESVDHVNTAIEKLKAELEKIQNTESPVPGVRAVIRRHVRKTLYPFKEETLRKIQKAVSEARSDLNLTLQVLHIESISDIRPEIKLLVRWKEDEETKNILHWLSTVNFWLKQQDVCRQREAGTGKWLLEHSKFLEWEKGNKETLWCYGSPGVGKTVLASAIIEFLETDLPLPSIGLAFTYCNHKENQVQSVEYFLGAIVRQLVERRSAIPFEVRSCYAKHRGKETKPTCQEYMDLLQVLAHEFSEVYVAIDALDECINKDGRIFWNELLSKLKSSISNLRLVYTSRDIEDFAGTLTSNRINIHASEADILAYVQAQVKSTESLLQICKQNTELENKIQQVIVSKAEGIFLAAQLYIEFLSSETNPRAVKRALNKLPSTLEENYHEAMKRIERLPNKALALNVLKWIVYAIRPLQVKEVLHAIAVDDLEPVDESVTEDCLALPSTIVNACAGMIRIDKESNVVGLVHKTTQEYFEKNGNQHFPHAHRDITASCLRYLSLKIFSRGPCSSYELFKRRLEENALLAYTIRSLGDHISQGFDCSLKDLALKVFLDEQTISSATQVLFTSIEWPFDFKYLQKTSFQGVHFVGLCGLTDILRLLIETGKVEVDSKDQYGRTPLSRAANHGHEAVVKLLLKTGKVEVDSKDQYGQTPLSWAALYGHEAVVKLLLKTGKVEVDLKDQYGQTPLSRAALCGYEAVVKLLLKTGKVEVDSKDQYGRTPLLWAADHGREAVVKLLLETGKVEVDSKDQYGQTPLSWAADYGREAVVKLLLETGKVEVDLKDQYGQTPLSRAADHGREAVVKLLLETGKVEVDLKDQYGRTPLSRAALYGREAVVKLLLKTGKVEVDSKDQYGQTPLSRAADHGREAVVKLLLETGKVEVDSKDRDGRTPLSWAADHGHEAVVKLLLETGKVEVDSKDRDGRTPLSWAADHGHEAVVKLLLETGKVEVDSKDRDGRTPLSWAADHGYEAVVKLLLKTGKVEVDSKDQYGRTPLSRAADHGREAVVKLLLKTGKVEVDSKDRDGQTPLSRAAYHGYEAVVKLLLETGKVEVDSKDQYGQTPLSWAADHGREAVVKLLLKTGKVEVDSKDQDGRTPLSRAADHGHEAVVKLLLKTGKVEVDSKDQYGRTPLSRAALYGYETVVKLLLKTGKVEVDSKDRDGRTPLSWAADYGQEAVVKLLLETGKVEVDSKD